MIKYIGTIKRSAFTNPAHKWVVSSEEKPLRKHPASAERASAIIRKIIEKGETPTIYKLVD